MTTTDPDVTRPASRLRWISLGVVGALVAVATGIGIGDAILAGEKAPAKAAAPVPVAAVPVFGVRPDGSHFGSLDDLLLPVPSGDSLGADDPAFGNDVVLAPAQYQPFFAEDFNDLAAGDRSELGSLIGLGGLGGAALRTYTVTDEMNVEIGLLQMSRSRVAAGPAVHQELLNATNVFRSAGVSLDGSTAAKAACYLPPLPEAGDRLDYLDCDGVAGDILVTVRAYGQAPLNSDAVAVLLQEQLARLTTPEAQA